MLTEIITKLDSAELSSKNGNVLSSMDQDIWKVAAFDRTYGTCKKAVGFLKNFGADIGAFASTWSFHENDLIVIGSNENDMATAANHLVKTQGGLIVVKNGNILSSLSLSFGGIISTESFDSVSKNLKQIISYMVDSGCNFKRPHLIPLFLPFLALPSIRILHAGIVNVKTRSILPTIKIS
jgi:adenine deaminase